MDEIEQFKRMADAAETRLQTLRSLGLNSINQLTKQRDLFQDELRKCNDNATNEVRTFEVLRMKLWNMEQTLKLVTGLLETALPFVTNEEISFQIKLAVEASKHSTMGTKPLSKP